MLGCISKKLEVSEFPGPELSASCTYVSAQVESHAGQRSVQKETSGEPRKASGEE